MSHVTHDTENETFEGENRTQQGHAIHDLDPSLIRQENPPAADSPPADEWDAELAAIGEEPAAEVEPFYLEGETPTAAAVPRTAEQHKAGVQRALETFGKNGDQRAGVADPTQDSGAGGTSKRGQHMADSWFAAQGLELDTVPRDVQKDFARAMTKLSAPYESLSDEQACRAVEIVLDRENPEFSYYTYSDPNVVKFKRDWAAVALRLLNGQTGYLTVQRKGGSSGPRKNGRAEPEPDPELQAAYDRIFDENGRRRPEYQ